MNSRPSGQSVGKGCREYKCGFVRACRRLELDELNRHLEELVLGKVVPQIGDGVANEELREVGLDEVLDVNVELGQVGVVRAARALQAHRRCDPAGSDGHGRDIAEIQREEILEWLVVV